MIKLESKDEFIKGAFAGALGSLAFYFFVQIFFWLGFIEYGQTMLAGDVAFKFENIFIMKVFAFFYHITFGALWGIVLSFLYSHLLTSRYLLLKGMFYGFALFILSLGLFDSAFKYPKDFYNQPFNIFIFLLGFLVYGLVTSISLKRFAIFD